MQACCPVKTEQQLKMFQNVPELLTVRAEDKVSVKRFKQEAYWLNQKFLDCLWWVSQSQKCVSSWIIQAYKNWAGCFGTPEQTTKGSGRLRKCYRLADVTQSVKSVCLTGSVNAQLFRAGASEPRNMAYMNRLGIWGPKTPFREFGNFIQAVERRYVSYCRRQQDCTKRKMDLCWLEWLCLECILICLIICLFVCFLLYPFRGVGAMEIVAMDMKLRGMYIARQLSFTGVTFKIEEVPLSQKYISMYNKSVKLVSAEHCL